jgi:hypothetical protein
MKQANYLAVLPNRSANGPRCVKLPLAVFRRKLAVPLDIAGENRFTVLPRPLLPGEEPSCDPEIAAG